MKNLLSSVVSCLNPQEKLYIFTGLDWLFTLEDLYCKANAASNLEEESSIEDQKQIFLNKIGCDEKILRDMLIFAKNFTPKYQPTLTEEGFKSLCKEIGDKFFIENPDFRINDLKTAFDKYNLEITPV